MKNTLDWHKNALQNSIHYQKELEQELQRTQEAMQKNIKLLDKFNKFAAFQIQEAEKRNISDFDSERFCEKNRESFGITLFDLPRL